MKRLLLYPFLFVLYIILIPLANNYGQLDPSLALRPLILLWLAVASGILLFYLIFRDWQYAGYLVFLVTVFFFASGHFYRFSNDQLSFSGKMLDERIFIVICVALIGILAHKSVWTRLGGRTWLPLYLNLVIAIGLLFPMYQLFVGFVDEPFGSRYESSSTQSNFGEMVLDCSKTPDIYYIILDGYGRAEVLQDLYGFDNQPFLEYLEYQGFYVATESYTNYIQSVFSIPSGLNFNFIDPPGEGVSGQSYFSGMVSHNEVMAILKRCGYRTVSIESGFSFTDHPDVDVYLTRGSGLNEFESLLLVDSPVEVIAKELNLVPSEFSYKAHRQRVRYSFEKLRSLYKMEGPKFVFAHIVSPHPPFVFDKSGQPIEPKRGYFIGDGDDFKGNLDEYLAGYAGQVEYVNHEMELVIASILANSSSPPIIIIQGDHGPGSRLDWDSPTQTCLWERTPILNAYYLPGDGDRFLYPSISPVNSFRVVLNTYFGTELPLLPDSTHFTSHRLERQVIDITLVRSSRANCSPP